MSASACIYASKVNVLLAAECTGSRTMQGVLQRLRRSGYMVTNHCTEQPDEALPEVQVFETDPRLRKAVAELLTHDEYESDVMQILQQLQELVDSPCEDTDEMPVGRLIEQQADRILEFVEKHASKLPDSLMEKAKQNRDTILRATLHIDNRSDQTAAAENKTIFKIPASRPDKKADTTTNTTTNTTADTPAAGILAVLAIHGD